jgi:hypothetical protein
VAVGHKIKFDRLTSVADIANRRAAQERGPTDA